MTSKMWQTKCIAAICLGKINMEGLWARGATITAYDPAAMKETRHIYQLPPHFRGRVGEGVILPSEQSLSFADTPLDALNNANALIIVTEWGAFKSPDFNVIKARLKQPVIFDGRNMFEPKDIKAMDIVYYVIGRECGATINREV
jgi:UDPglucose 6-dehydrogenase